MKFSAETKIVQSSEVLSQEVNGETVLLDLTGEQYFGLDPVGTRVWQLTGDNKPLGEILAVLLREYDVDEARLKSDLDELVERLLQAGLVRMDSGA
ncbi:MAG TPA: PqqD family protein [Xanthomonadales bacterium]|nr:PqqD family protein [Xanthomonadales bacterium]